ncbi:sugar transferase [Chroococcidiopsis thermalis]|uniref:Exopolysaccharide biosynthesis polyprenyl glycosylphosphotransferase n=1 Tax=Chroococcidiopsis thermalis (strain PCC 7203) TaxID=251229 RepID=K9TXR3_CHRTP|nr:sugar transferase [Chroococcidiopsis thermalis]AFY87632.1 exopolysaccharide biosynthesis polyprenyl glycosylphosphotransferase [Chroococcidiopsis thermalis PCC 7203]
MSTAFLNQASLDLREPVFAKIRKGSWWLRSIALVATDYTLLLLAWIVSENYAYWNFSDRAHDSWQMILLAVTVQIVALALQGSYQLGKKRYRYLNIIKTLIFAHGLILLFGFRSQSIFDSNRSTLILSLLTSIFFVCAGRLSVDFCFNHLHQRRILDRDSVFVICDPENYEQCLTTIKEENRYTIRGMASPKALDRYSRRETLEQLNKLGITEVFVSWDAIKNRMFLRWLFQASGIALHILPMELKPIYRDIEFKKIGGMTCLSFDCPVITGKDFWLKRIMDFIAAALFIAFTFPIYIAIAIAIKLDSPGSIFFKQTRIGLHGKPFQVWKFRTMKADAEKFQKELEALNNTKDGILFKIKDDPRITRIGKFLRRYSLDELPQLFNVLLGEMSLVGPRPLPIRDVEKFSEQHFIRQEVLPGVTGLWQVSGRSNILDFDQVIKLDLNYIENWSLGLDFEIVLKTVQVVLKKEGAY